MQPLLEALRTASLIRRLAIALSHGSGRGQLGEQSANRSSSLENRMIGRLEATTYCPLPFGRFGLVTVDAAPLPLFPGDAALNICWL